MLTQTKLNAAIQPSMSIPYHEWCHKPLTCNFYCFLVISANCNGVCNVLLVFILSVYNGVELRQDNLIQITKFVDLHKQISISLYRFFTFFKVH